MRSLRPKVLHAIAGRSLIGHVLATAQDLGGEVAVVVGPGHDAVVDEVRRILPQAMTVVQAQRRGTAHAVGMAREAIARGADDVIVMFGDTPLITAETLQRLRNTIAEGAAVGVVGFRAANPAGYGRLIMEGGRLRAIREHKDASDAERAIDFCNGGLMAFAGETMLSLIDAIGDHNANSEFYLTDAVEIANARGLSVIAIETTEDELQGVNTQGQLAQAEAALQERLRTQAMEAGVSMVAPQTVFLSADTKLGRDVVIEPYVVFGPGVTIDDRAVIRSFSHLEGAQVGEGARVGPYARLRPGAKIGPKVRIGNFVEVKEAEIGEGAQANHLTYIGDADVGAGTNIGAGTITCNYDSAKKHRTRIGARAFIGSNTALVAPVSVGDEAYVGSGSVITDNVPEGALALGRARQVVKEGWARRLRALVSVGKSGRKDV